LFVLISIPRLSFILKHLNQEANLPFLIIHLGSERVRAVRAEVFVFVSIREDQKKALAYRHSLAAARAKKGTGFKLFIGGLGLLRRAGLGGVMRFHGLPLAPTMSISRSM
jgi:hypothetical protein